jgi:hypothetical protein
VDKRVSGIRGIPEPPPVPYRFVSHDELVEFLGLELENQETIDQIKAAEDLYRALGLIARDADLFAEYSALLGSQVLGAYDPDAKEFVVLQPDGEFGPLEEFTYAHEFVHRLQDAQFDLNAVGDLSGDNDDRDFAITSLVEGDATSAQTIYGLRYMDLVALARIAAESGDALEAANDAPYVLRRQLEFPYVEGAQFVDRLIVSGGYAAVDAAFADPPDSTEQVMHPDKYLDRETPDTVALPEGIFGEGWTSIDDNVAGEFFLKTWLIGVGATQRNATAAAAGWGGDTYTLRQNEAGELAFALSIVWDDPAKDPSEFFTVLSAALEASDDFTSVNVNASPGVLVFNGPGGSLVIGNLPDGSGGGRTVVTVAPDLNTAMTALLANFS